MASSSLLTEAEEVLLLLDLTLPDLGEIFKPPRPAISAATIQHGELGTMLVHEVFWNMK